MQAGKEQQRGNFLSGTGYESGYEFNKVQTNDAFDFVTFVALRHHATTKTRRKPEDRDEDSRDMHCHCHCPVGGGLV